MQEAKTNDSAPKFLYMNGYENLKELNDETINAMPVATVCDLLTQLKSQIEDYEHICVATGHHPDEKILNPVVTTISNLNSKKEHIVFKFFNIAKWRRGFGYVGLQLSDRKRYKIIVIISHTVFHSAISFGTTPNLSDAKELYDNACAQFKSDMLINIKRDLAEQSVMIQNS